MPFRFRRRINLGPIHLNVSKTGLSLSLRTFLGTHNFPLGSRRPRRFTVNLPGVGLAWQWQSHKRPRKDKRK